MKIWESRWQEDRIGFHLKEVNPYLIKFSDQLLFQNPDRVFVPLCGKTLDLCWLSKKTKKVIAIALVKKAVQDFFSEIFRGGIIYYCANSISIPQVVFFVGGGVFSH